MTGGHGGRLDAGIDPELGENMGDMGVHRTVAYQQGTGDFTVGLADGDESQHLQLAFRELMLPGDRWNAPEGRERGGPGDDCLNRQFLTTRGCRRKGCFAQGDLG